MNKFITSLFNEQPVQLSRCFRSLMGCNIFSILAGGGFVYANNITAIPISIFLWNIHDRSAMILRTWWNCCWAFQIIISVQNFETALVRLFHVCIHCFRLFKCRLAEAFNLEVFLVCLWSILNDTSFSQYSIPSLFWVIATNNHSILYNSKLYELEADTGNASNQLTTNDKFEIHFWWQSIGYLHYRQGL